MLLINTTTEKKQYNVTHSDSRQSFVRREQLLVDPLPLAPFQTCPHGAPGSSTIRCTVTAPRLVQSGFQTHGHRRHRICAHVITKCRSRKSNNQKIAQYSYMHFISSSLYRYTIWSATGILLLSVRLSVCLQRCALWQSGSVNGVESCTICSQEVTLDLNMNKHLWIWCKF